MVKVATARRPKIRPEGLNGIQPGEKVPIVGSRVESGDMEADMGPQDLASSAVWGVPYLGMPAALVLVPRAGLRIFPALSRQRAKTLERCGKVGVWRGDGVGDRTDSGRSPTRTRLRIRRRANPE